MPKNKGFTALELMVTIGIIAVIAAIGVPAYQKYIPRYKLSKDVTNLKADLEMAKLRAKRENTCVGASFTTNDYTIFMDNGGGSATCNNVFDGNERIIEYQELSPGNRFLSTGVLTRFRGNGEAVTADINLRGYGGAGTKTIRVQFLGRIQILKN